MVRYVGVVPPATGVDPGAGPQYANSLGNNYPNPFNPTTNIKYSIKERAHVSLKIYNAAGQLVRTLVDEVQAPDEVKPVEWDGRNNADQTVSSGVYFYRLVTKNFSQTKKTVFLK
jgi:flagellar hook assembly protein FlgD